jgi:choice-of-anchor A domain-containing protein
VFAERNVAAARGRSSAVQTARKTLGVALAAGAALAFGAGGANAATNLQVLSNVASTYNLFLSGDMGSSSTWISGSDVEGRVAVGGSAYLQNYSVGLNTPGGVDLTVGQNLNFKSGTIHGAVVTGGNASFTSATVDGTVSTGGTLLSPPSTYSGHTAYTGLPINFTTTAAALQAASTQLDSSATQAKGAIGSVSNSYGTLTLSSAAKGLVFFDITGSQLAGINGLDFNVGSGSTVVVNVTGPVGSSISMGNFGFQGDYNASHTLFNFLDATSIAITGVGFEGSILALKASVAFNNGQENGAVMAKSWTGGAQVNEDAFAGDFLPIGGVPEPAAWMMMMLGLFGMGAMLRSARRKAAGAAAA